MNIEHSVDVDDLIKRVAELEKMVGKIKSALDIDSYTDFFNHVKMIIELWEVK